jgi:hypothetical protein
VEAWRADVAATGPALDRWVAVVLSGLMDEAGQVEVAAGALAELVGLSERRVRDHVASLVRRGWLEVAEEGGSPKRPRSPHVLVASTPRKAGRNVRGDDSSGVTERQGGAANLLITTGDDSSGMTERPPSANGKAASPGNTPPVVPPSGDGSAGKPASRERRSLTRVPEPFVVTDRMRLWAAAETPTVDVDDQTASFIDHARAQDRRVKDWEAAWRNWLRKAHRDLGRRNGHGHRPEAVNPVTGRVRSA